MAVCKTCFFFRRQSKRGGACKRFPPVMMAQENPHEQRGSWIEQHFPWVENDEWCGEWRQCGQRQRLINHPDKFE